MERPNPPHDNEEFLKQLQDSAELLVENLQKDQLEEASELIHKLFAARDSHIYNSVGKLTRALHEAIVNFNVDADIDSYPLESKGSEIKDASDRLHYVIKMTQAAANKTLDKVEILAPMAINLSKEADRIKQEWTKLQSGKMDKQEFSKLYFSVDNFLQQIESGANELTKNLQDIIIEQSYQDLIGQVLEKVIGLVTDVEGELVNLMRIAGHVEQVTGLNENRQPVSKSKKEKKQAEGPQIHAGKIDGVVAGQDEVDDLLSSLGF